MKRRVRLTSFSKGFESGNDEMDLRKLPICYILLVIAVIIFSNFTIAVKNGAPLKFDQAVSSFFTKIFTEYSYPFFKLLNIIGSSIGIGLTALIAVAIIWMKNSDYVGMSVLAITVATGSLLNKAAKNLIARPRPETEHLVYVKSLSFPSGHAMMSTILYLLIAYFIAKNSYKQIEKWLLLLIVFIIILLMGISRIVLQVHYPSDVVAGFTLGIIWAFIGVFMYEILCMNVIE